MTIRPLIAVLASLAALTAGAAECEKLADTCVEGPATRTIGGYAVTRECWRFESQYRCIAATATDDCQALRDQGCSVQDSTCIDASPSGPCLLEQQNWRCKAGGGSTSTVTDCGGRIFCLDARCFDNGHLPDADFARAVSGMEALREAGQSLDPGRQIVFNGSEDRCRKKLGGLLDCCKPSGVDGSPLAGLAALPGSASPARASRYTYEALFGEAPRVLEQLSRLDPLVWTSDALSALFSCEETEKVLAVKRERHLCHAAGSFCSQRVAVIGSCIETSESYCCFRSRLARLLHQQGRAQIGRAWGSAEAPDCGGFTVDELQRLDFSRMDLSEFYAEVVPSLPTASAVRSRVEQRIQSWQAP